MVGRALSFGEKLEDLGCFYEALLIYDEVLAAPDDRRSALDAGRLTHRIGNCAAATGDNPRAFGSYLAAAVHARDLGMLRRCGESLASVGWCLAKGPVTTSVADVVPSDLVEAAFSGVLEDARDTLLRGDAPTLEQGAVIHARFAGLTILSAEVALDREPSLAAEALHFDILTEFSALHDVPNRVTVDELVVVAFIMGALARLCRDLGEQGRQHRAGLPPTREAAAAMDRFVADAFVSGMREPIRLWLYGYLRDQRGACWATDAHLSARADDRLRERWDIS